MTLSRPLCPRQCAALMTDNSSSRRSLKVTSGSVDGEDNDVLPDSPLRALTAAIVPAMPALTKLAPKRLQHIHPCYTSFECGDASFCN